MINLELPKDRATLNANYRYYYSTNYIVNESIDYNTYLIKNNLNSTASNEFSKNLFSMLDDIIREYQLIGECFLYNYGDDLKLLNQDYVLLKHNLINNKPDLFLRPDEILRAAVKNKNKIIEKLNDDVVKCIQDGENIPISGKVQFILNKMNPYDIRGTSDLLSKLKILNMLNGVSDEAEFNTTYKELQRQLYHPTALQTAKSLDDNIVIDLFILKINKIGFKIKELLNDILKDYKVNVEFDSNNLRKEVIKNITSPISFNI